MALTAVTTGAQEKATDLSQIINLLTGQMTDQAVTFANAVSLAPGVAGANPANTSWGSVPVKLFDTRLAAAAATVTYSSIPQTFRNLWFEFNVRDTSAGTSVSDFGLQLNGDTGATYSASWGQAVNATTQAFQGIALTSGHVGATVNGGAVAASASHGRIVMPNYAGTTFSKGWEVLFGMASAMAAGSVYTQFVSGFWNNSAAIASVTLLCGNGSFAVGCTFTGYGEP